MSFPRYPKYKDSGVEWLGAVPEHWEVKPVKSLASIVNGYPFDSTLFDAAEGYPLIRIRDLNKFEAETYYKGEFVKTAAITSDDVLVGMDGDFNVGRWRGQGIALLNQRMCCVRGRSELLTRLLEYSLPIRLKAINDITYATTVKHLASSQVEKILVAIPPDSAEQTQIAAFLDRETLMIDALVTEQRRLMELLKEKRQAVISHAVTQGLNPHAPMKPSGIEWLGDVPAHWGIWKLAHAFAQIGSGTTPRTDNRAYYEDGEIPWVNTGDLNDGDLENCEKRVTMLALADHSSLKIYPTGSVLIAMYGATIGRLAVLRFPATVNQACCVFADSSKIEAKFMFYLFMGFRQHIISLATGGGQPNVSQEILRTLRVSAPGHIEQKEIVDFLDTESAKFDTLTAEAQRGIDLLQERRSALISAAVTGQIDVRAINFSGAHA